jgi:hypothetical protein
MEFAQQSTTEAGKKPKKQTEAQAEQDAGRERKIKRRVLAFVDDIAGQAAQPEREPSAKIKKSSNERKNACNKEQRPAEFAKRFHETEPKM